MWGESTVRILIFTAKIGGGHEALSHALEHELVAEANDVTVVDGLRILSPMMSFIVRWGYIVQLKWLPWTIGPLFIFKTHPRVAPRLRTFYGTMYGWRLRRVMDKVDADLIVSTYPLLTIVLDHLKRRDTVSAPIVTVIADYGAHNLWIGPTTDDHLVSSFASAELVRDSGGHASVVVMPISKSFETAPDKATARAHHALPDGAFVALVVGGAWGVGDIEKTVAKVAESGCYPLVIAGNNKALKERLERRFPDPNSARIIGWTAEMPSLMAASDCLVQNAGGMTCHEAAAVGLPILFYRPIPGHGAFNAKIMDQAGAARIVTKDAELVALLRKARSGEITLPAPPARTATGASEMIQLMSRRPALVPLAPTRKHAAPMRAYRWAASMSLLALLLWTIVSPVVGGAAFSFMRPESVSAGNLEPGGVALVLRVDDPLVASALEVMIISEKLPIAMFVDAKAASGLTAHKDIIIGVAQHGSGTMLIHPLREWDNDSDVAQQIRAMQGKRKIYVLPPKGGRTLIASALAPDSSKELISISRHKLKHSGIIELDVSGMTIAAASALVHDELTRMHEAGYKCVSLPSLS